MMSIARVKIVRFATAFAALAACALVVLSLSSLNLPIDTDNALVQLLLFYVLTTGAYCALPFVRRGDIAVVAMWLVLAAGVAPGFAGREISAVQIFSNIAGVLMAVAPMYVARFRQVLQGDMRPQQRRIEDRAV